MLWVLVIAVVLGIVAWNAINKDSRSLAEHQVGATDPENKAGAEVIGARLVSANVSKASNGSATQPRAAAVTVDNVFINFRQSLNGAHELIVQTLEGVSAMFQGEVDSRAARSARRIDGKQVDASMYLTTVSQQFDKMAGMFEAAEASFTLAGSPKGSPDLLRNAYGNVLDRLLEVRRTLQSMDAPPMFQKTEAAYEAFIDSFYRQISDWPKQIAKAATQVKGDRYDLQLSAVHDVAPLERAIASESPASRSAKSYRRRV